MLITKHGQSKKQADTKAQSVKITELSDIDSEITNAQYVQAKKGWKS